VTNANQVQQTVRGAEAHFGRLGVVVNNAGYPLVGAIEEASEADARAEFDTNYFGALRVIQAALPLLRRQCSGHTLGVFSGMGLVAVPLTGHYCATKGHTRRTRLLCHVVRRPRVSGDRAGHGCLCRSSEADVRAANKNGKRQPHGNAGSPLPGRERRKPSAAPHPRQHRLASRAYCLCGSPCDLGRVEGRLERRTRRAAEKYNFLVPAQDVNIKIPRRLSFSLA